MSSGCALYRENGDFLFIRKCICGFSRESLVAVTTDIESRELRQRTNMEDGLLPEHPCASTMDNVECFFSMPHDYIGKYFTASWNFRRCPWIPVHHFKSSHNRFHEGPHPSQGQGRQRIPHHVQLGSLVTSHATMVATGTLSMWVKFHKYYPHHLVLQFTQLTILTCDTW